MAFETTLRKQREIRDIYNHLRVKHRSNVIMEFLEINYFIGIDGVYAVLQKVDKEPVTEPSIVYQTVMRDDFKL